MHVLKCDKCTLLLSFAATLMAGNSTSIAADLFVDEHADPASLGEPQNGTTWARAYTSLQDALKDNSLVLGDTIFVGGGTYATNDDNPGLLDRTQWFLMINGVAVEGGYAGWRPTGDGGVLVSNPDERGDPYDKTTLTGFLGNDQLGEPQHSYHVVAAANIIDNLRTTLDGFTITGGIADGGPAADDFVPKHRSKGGGLYTLDSDLTVIRCIFEGNKVEASAESGHGGGAAVQGHIAGQKGTEFINCVFRNNTAVRGAAVAVSGFKYLPDIQSTPPVTAKATMTNCLIHDNDAPAPDPSPDDDGMGSVLVFWQASLRMVNCTIVNNTADRFSAGLVMNNVDDPDSPNDYAPGTPCDLNAGSATDPEKVPQIEVRNCVFWGNRAEISGLISQVFQGGGTNSPCRFMEVDVKNSIIEGGEELSTNHIKDEGVGIDTVLDEDPDFADDANANFRLIVGSPGINVGATANVPADTFDLDTDLNTAKKTPDLDLGARETGPKVDLGAYELLTCKNDFANQDGVLGIEEFLMVLAKWGDCPGSTCGWPDCPADVRGTDCAVGIEEFLYVLAHWGEGCTAAGGLGPSLNSEQSPSRALFASMYGPVSDKWDEVMGGGFPSTIITRYRKAADDFVPDVTADVSRVYWWGFYDDEGADCKVGYSDSFTITYYEVGCHNTTGGLIPGTVKQSFTVTPTRNPHGELPNGTTLYSYFVTHDALELTGGTTYFIEISNAGGDANGSTGCHWRWAWSDDGLDLYSARNPEDADDYADATDPDHAMNLAFGLNILFVEDDDPLGCQQ